MEIKKIRVGGRKPTPAELAQMVDELSSSLRTKGFSAYVFVKNSTAIRIAGGIRLTDSFIKSFGRNFSYSGRRTHNLNWDQYRIVNNTINDILDRHNVSAKVTSLKGRFVIRAGMKRYIDDDWERQKWRNVGSIMKPVFMVYSKPNEFGNSYEDFITFRE